MGLAGMFIPAVMNIEEKSGVIPDKQVTPSPTNAF
jgi:hypothetical protein